MNTDKPVFAQIIEMIEDDILAGRYNEGELIISIPQMAKVLSVNPTTAAKSVTILADRGIVVKKRGLGMAVTKEAKQIILNERQEAFYNETLPAFIKFAEKIGIDKDTLSKLVKEDTHD